MAPNEDIVTLKVRITRQTAEDLKRVAASEYRPVVGEIRRLIEARIAEFDAEPEQEAA